MNQEHRVERFRHFSDQGSDGGNMFWGQKEEEEHFAEEKSLHKMELCVNEPHNRRVISKGISEIIEVDLLS